MLSKDKLTEQNQDNCEGYSGNHGSPRLTVLKITPLKAVIFTMLVFILVIGGLELSLRIVGFKYVPPSDFALFTHSNDVFADCIAYDPDSLYMLKPGT